MSRWKRAQLFSFTPLGLSPAQVRHAYGFDNVSFQAAGRTIRGDGSGQTIAVVDAYDDPNVYTDLRSFDHQFGLTDWDASGQFVLTKARPEGRTSPDAGWALEESLDVEWAHAIAPKAHVLLVEAASAGVDDLLTAVDYARSQPGVVAVSMSWGASEFPAESFYDDTLTTPPAHVGGSGLRGGVAFVTSSGDQGTRRQAGPRCRPTCWPSVARRCGWTQGATISAKSPGRRAAGERVLRERGHQRARRRVRRGSQHRLRRLLFLRIRAHGSVGEGRRHQRRVAAVGGAHRHGRSRPCPQSSRFPDPAQTLADIHRIPAADFHDIVAGSNGIYSAGPGYDLVTGRGTPFADRVIRDIVRL